METTAKSYEEYHPSLPDNLMTKLNAEEMDKNINGDKLYIKPMSCCSLM
jgi:hypothetical protein